MTCEDPELSASLGGLGTSCPPPAKWARRRAVGRIVAARGTDAGLGSERSWRRRAAERLAAAPGCVALLLIDPSRPDAEQAAVRCLRGIVRPADPLGRYGTRQIAVLVQVDLASVGVLLAHRVRAALDRAGVECAVGMAVSAGEGLGELLIRAGSDLMARRDPGL